MNLFYAMGGGMGHVYRTWIFIQHFKITEYKVISANPLVRKLFTEDHIIFLDADRYEESWNAFVNNNLPSLHTSALYIDTFPAGITGELSTLVVDFPVYYIARRMRWKNYVELTSSLTLSFSKVFQLEPLESDHEGFIRNRSSEIASLRLEYPVGSVANIPKELIPTHRPVWLIVHAFHKEETETLLQYAKDVARLEKIKPCFVVLSDQDIEISEGMWVQYFPAADWFPLADKIFMAAGFNSVQQATPYLDKVNFFPFPRKYDDQAWRMATVKSLVNNGSRNY
jgi:hypothetical protein